MKTSIGSTLVRSVSALALALGLTLASGCGGAYSDGGGIGEVGTLGQGLVSTSGITATATYAEVVTGTPTYGSPATSPVLTVHVEVDDAALRKGFPGFDGLERAFALVPKLAAGRLVWESVSLRYSGETRRGYYADIKIDLHDSGPIWCTGWGVDWETLRAQGVAIGLETNLGVIWAQAEGKNLAVGRR